MLSPDTNFRYVKESTPRNKKDTSSKHLLDSYPQRLTLLRLVLVDAVLLQHQQGLGNGQRIAVAAKHPTASSAAVMEPSLNQIEHVVGDVATVAALKGGFVVVEHGFEDGQYGLVWDLQVQESVDYPGRRTDASLVFEGVLFEHGDEVGDWEGAFREVQSSS